MDAAMALFSRKRYIFTWIFENGLQRALIIGERVRASDISFRYVPSALARASMKINAMMYERQNLESVNAATSVL